MLVGWLRSELHGETEERTERAKGEELLSEGRDRGY